MKKVSYKNQESGTQYATQDSVKLFLRIVKHCVIIFEN